MTAGISARVRSILRHPVTLEPYDDGELPLTHGVLDARPNALTAKNAAELQFALEEYTEPDGQTYVDRLPHMPHPEIEDEAVVLDLGSGPRSFLTGLAGEHVFVDDIMVDYVTRAGAQFEGLPICAGAELLPFADDSIDVVYSINMLDHVDDVPETLYELHRVLAPTGVVVLQTYFNSHPLLQSEPGVIDRFAFDSLIEPFFVVSDLRTHAVQSPEISDYYTMGILACHLRPRHDVRPPVRDRRRYSEPGYIGPQSRITECLTAIEAGDFDTARRHIEVLEANEHYTFHAHLLDAKLAVFDDRPRDSEESIRRAREHPSGRRNPYARIAIKEIEAERRARWAETLKDRLAKSRDGIERRNGRVEELESSVSRLRSRIESLEDGIRRRDNRIEELSGAIHRRDLRIASLQLTGLDAAAGDERSALQDRTVELRMKIAEHEARWEGPER